MKVDALSRLLDVILDDLSARFIINLPEEELSSVTRICFGLEQAHWFYEDFFRPLHPELPSVNLRAFTAALFSHCPLLWKFSGQHEAAFDDFLKYKIRVPVRGAIMLNQDMTKCVLVKGWKASAGWGFPKGKIDQDEDDADCAVREVREECGFDISGYVKEKDFIDMVMKEQSVRLYVLRGIPLDSKFEPQTRKEISKIDWFDLDTLPTYKKDPSSEVKSNMKNNKFYMVAPFLAPLRRWIKRNKPKAKKLQDAAAAAAATTTDNMTKAPEDVMEVQPTSVVSERHTNDASSQALKLLMGIVDVPQEDTRSEQNSKASASSQRPVERDPTHIDLASLFQQSFTQTPKSTKHMSNPANDPSIQSNAVPLNILNTSIEASIMDQLLPAANRAGPGPRDPSIDGSNRRANYQQMPTNIPTTSSYPPSWFPQDVIRPLGEPRFPPPTSYLPVESPFALHGHILPHGSSSQLPMRAGLGPPGLQPGNSSQSPARKLNPNAPSLLALLKPQDHQDRASSQQNYINLPPAYPDASTRARMPMSQSDHNPATGNHKQSLLALLKPGDHGVSSNHSSSTPVPSPFQQGPSQATRPSGAVQGQMQNSSRDAFLLDYLTQAANSLK